MRKKNDLIHQRIFETFFGTPLLPNDVIIITPIEKIFKAIGNNFPVIEKTKGWWKRMRVKIDSFLITVLKIPSGTNYIRDCLNVLEDCKIKGMIFLGYCTSFNKKIKIGEIVIPTEAVFGKRKFSLTNSQFFPLPRNKKYKIVLLQRLLLPKRRIKKIRAQLGDMETYFLYKFSKVKNIPAVALLIVTDSPLFYPFYFISKREKIKLNFSIKKLMVLLKRYISRFQRKK